MKTNKKSEWYENTGNKEFLCSCDECPKLFTIKLSKNGD